MYDITYPDWIVNMVLVKKNNDKWRICVDFTDLDNTCLKDNFPLLRIDALVEFTSGLALLSFMDVFYQIQMKEGDQEKTLFITNRGTYY